MQTEPSQSVCTEALVCPPKGAVSAGWGGGQTPWSPSQPVFLDRFQACFFKPPPTPSWGGGRSKSLLPSVPRDQFLSHLSCIEFCLFFVGFIIYILNAWTPRNSDGAVREMREPPPPRSGINRSFQVYFRKKQNERK